MKNQNTVSWLWLALAVGVLTAAPVHAFYNPQTGHWLNRDPIGELGFEVFHKQNIPIIERKKGPSLYEFADNNPINMIDVLGLTGEDYPIKHYKECRDWLADPDEEGCTACCLAQYNARISAGYSEYYSGIVLRGCQRACSKSCGLRGPTLKGSMDPNPKPKS